MGRYGKVNTYIFATIYCTCINKVLHSLNTEKHEYVKWFCSSALQVKGTVHFVTEFKYLSSTVTCLEFANSTHFELFEMSLPLLSTIKFNFKQNVITAA